MTHARHDSDRAFPASADFGYRARHRPKARWAGIQRGHAFNHNLDYRDRLLAQRQFYQQANQCQRAVARQLGIAVDAAFAPKVEPQLGPCYTTYPAALAAEAAIGLTAFLEARAWLGPQSLLAARLKTYLENPAALDEVAVSGPHYQRVAQLVADAVGARLLLEDLGREGPAGAAIELYRLFAAGQLDTDLGTVRDIVRAVVLYGDVLPPLEGGAYHPLTAAMARDIATASQPFFARLPHDGSAMLLALGEDWVRTVSRALARYLPPADPDAPAAGSSAEPTTYRYREARGPVQATDRLPPLNGPTPPALLDEAVAPVLRGLPLPAAGTPAPAKDATAPAGDPALQAQLQQCAATLAQASGQDRRYEDLRSDLVEAALRASDFNPGPLQGSAAAGHDLRLQLGGKSTGGEIFDRPLPLSDNLPAYEALLGEAEPITRALRRVLYPNIEATPVQERFRASGALDAGRLPLAACAGTVFKRFRIREQADKRGRAVLLLACDGSGSLNARQMKMLKVLTTAWLQSTIGTQVQVLAGLYHSGEIRRGLTGSLVQWLYHPRKTPAVGRRDAARTLPTLPEAGTGVQADALSLAFMLDEARRLARGKQIYCILLTDCAWNVSFHAGLSGLEEVRSVLTTHYEALGDRLHVTLVALGVEKETQLENRVDRVIQVKPAELQDATAVAHRIGQYVAAAMRSRRRRIASPTT